MDYIDYYKILGIARSASADDVRRAYRKLARKYHPDVNKESDAEQRFKEINEAYEVLKDPEKRKLYDQYGKDWDQARQQPPPGWEYQHNGRSGGQGHSRTFHFRNDGSFGEGGDFSDFFKNLFGGGFSQQHQGSEFDFGFDSPGRSHEAEITLSLEEAYHGTTKTISFQTYEAGSRGELQPKTRTLQVKVPRGVTNGSVIRLAGQGEQGSGRGAAGDLLLRITIAPDARFRVVGHDLHTRVAVTPWEAALGAKIPVQTVGGKGHLTVPAGTRNGRRFRLKGKGLPRKDDKAGDLIVVVEVQVPASLSREEKRLFEELASASSFDPRNKYGQKAGYDEEI